MTREFGKHLHVTYGRLNSCVNLNWSHQHTVISSTRDRTNNHRMEIEQTTTECRSRNSTTMPN